MQGKSYGGAFASEKWIDIRSPNVMGIMSKRFDFAKQIGCDGIEPDNTGAHSVSPKLIKITIPPYIVSMFAKPWPPLDRMQGKHLQLIQQPCSKQAERIFAGGHWVSSHQS